MNSHISPLIQPSYLWIILADKSIHILASNCIFGTFSNRIIGHSSFQAADQSGKYGFDFGQIFAATENVYIWDIFYKLLIEQPKSDRYLTKKGPINSGPIFRCHILLAFFYARQIVGTVAAPPAMTPIARSGLPNVAGTFPLSQGKLQRPNPRTQNQTKPDQEIEI